MGCPWSQYKSTPETGQTLELTKNGEAFQSDQPPIGPNQPHYLKEENTLCSGKDFRTVEFDSRLPFTKREAYKLLQSWRGIKRNISAAGVEMFSQLFKTNASLQTMFQGFKDIRSDDELRSNEALEYHATLVMTTLDDAITHIDNYDFVRQLLHKTGGSHIKFIGFKPENFMAIKEPFLEAVRVTLGDRYTENMQNIYSIAITFILQTLIDGMVEASDKSAEANKNSNGAV